MADPPAPPLISGPAAAAAAAAAQLCPATDVPIFCKEKHVSYWLRCLRSPLPHQYTSNDSIRMTLAFFTVSALDLLGVLHTKVTSAEREAYVDWIYSCQHPEGGFRAFPGTDFGQHVTEENKCWDPANLPGTYFALGALAILGDDLRRVNRDSCLQWLRKLQREDGSFGQTLGEGGSIEGGMDTRFGYCATGVRWLLRGALHGRVSNVPDVDTDGLIRCIRESETHDGGISEQPFLEAHAGFTYCAIGAMSFLSRTSQANEAELVSRVEAADGTSKAPTAIGLSDPDNTIRWLMCRLTTLIEEDEPEDEDDGDDDGENVDGEDSDVPSVSASTNDLRTSGLLQTPQSSFSSDGDQGAVSTEKDSIPQEINSGGSSAQQLAHEALARQPSATANQTDVIPTDLLGPELSLVNWAGFNGRVNKVADTCYAFWVGGSLKILDSLELVDQFLVQRFLLEKTQHTVMGGFGKRAGDLPDIFHSYLGLAALSMLGHGDDNLDQGEHHNTNSPTAASSDVGRAGSGDATTSQVTNSSAVLNLAAAGASSDIDQDFNIQPPTARVAALDPTLCMSVRARKWIESLKRPD